jgi:hypothetical protein
MACILCGRPFASSIDDPSGGERREVLVCGAHSEDDLSAMDLESLWAGGDTSPGVIHDDPAAKLAGAWELGPGGAHAVYLLLDGGDLLLVTPSWRSVELHRVPRDKRMLAEPKGIALHDDPPWPLLVSEHATLASIRRDHDGRLQLAFPGRGILTVASEHYSWRELGDGKDFLAETWSPQF